MMGEVRTEVLHSGQKLGDMVRRVNASALSRHNVDRIPLSGLKLRLVFACLPPSCKSVLDSGSRTAARIFALHDPDGVIVVQVERREQNCDQERDYDAQGLELCRGEQENAEKETEQSDDADLLRHKDRTAQKEHDYSSAKKNNPERIG